MDLLDRLLNEAEESSQLQRARKASRSSRWERRGRLEATRGAFIRCFGADVSPNDAAVKIDQLAQQLREWGFDRYLLAYVEDVQGHYADETHEFELLT